MRGRVGKCIFLGAQPFIFVVVDDCCTGELVDLEAKKIDLACSRALISSQGCEGGIDLGEVRSGGAQRFEVGGAESVKRLALRSR